MTRKKWSAQTEVTEDLVRSREKRKWQIALRRYVIERNPSPYYAPFFGLDIDSMRTWFENQFKNGVNWEDFGKKWQFEHVLPISFFRLESEEELRLCWNFTNLKAGLIEEKGETATSSGITLAKKYFTVLSKRSDYPVCAQLLQKIIRIEEETLPETAAQLSFLQNNHEYIAALAAMDQSAFELINQGRTLEEARKEINSLKKYSD